MHASLPRRHALLTTSKARRWKQNAVPCCCGLFLAPGLEHTAMIGLGCRPARRWNRWLPESEAPVAGLLAISARGAPLAVGKLLACEMERHSACSPFFREFGERALVER